MKPTAWYDPSNGVVSTDRDSPLFTPLGQVWPLYPKREWVDLNDEEIKAVAKRPSGEIPMTGRMWVFASALLEKIKEKNNGQ